MRTDPKQTTMSTMSPFPAFPHPIPCQSARQGKIFPAVVLKSGRKALILQDLALESRKFPCFSGSAGKSRHSADGAKAGGGCPDLVSPPRLRYISPSVGGV